jgi:phage gpG-like protein
LSKLKLDEALKKFEQVKKTLPEVLANDAQRFFMASFRKEGWDDGGIKPWEPRKNESSKDKGRNLLVKTGRLRRAVANSLRGVTWGLIKFVVDVPYAIVHNEGGTFTRKQHVRGVYSSRTVEHTGIFRGTKTKQRIDKRESEVIVKANNATYPQRKFMGDSLTLRNLQRKKINLALRSIWQT